MSTLSKLRIAVTGLGAVTPLGNTLDDTWQALMDGKSGLDTITHFDASSFPTRIAGEVKNFNCAEQGISKKLENNNTAASRYAYVAAREALQDAGIAPTEETACRWGLVLGSGIAGADFDYWIDFQKVFAKDGQVDINLLGQKGLEYANATDFRMTQTNGTVGLLTKQFNIQGYANSVHTACASG